MSDLCQSEAIQRLCKLIEGLDHGLVTFVAEVDASQGGITHCRMTRDAYDGEVNVTRLMREIPCRSQFVVSLDGRK